MLQRISDFLGTNTDNSPLVIFRMFFGFLVACETFGAILTGWVEKTLVKPDFTFSFIGLEWLQPLQGNGMYYYFIIMGICGLLIMLGLFYRFSSLLFFVMWTAVYLMQKSEYNNHYYMLILLSGAMAMMPAHRGKSLDIKLGIAKPADTCQNVCIWFFIVQIMIVYVFASTNKMHIDWLMARPIGIWFKYKANYWLIGPLLTKEWFQYVIAWGGVVYDGLVFFLLLYKPTRKLGFALSLIFNLFNSAVFQIGIFPYLMIALTVFFFPAETIKNLFFKSRTLAPSRSGTLSRPLTWAVVIYFLWQIILPVRHHLYRGDVHWTEEGHKMAWQMMLRAKSSQMKVDVVNRETGVRTPIKLGDYVTRNQRRGMGSHPDIIWQFAQIVREDYRDRGEDVAVYVNSKVSLNGHPFQPIVNPEVDLGSVAWDRWKHSDWILLNNKNEIK